MARIRIVYPGVSQANMVLRRALQELETMEGTLASIQQAIPSEIQSRHEIGEKLVLCFRSVEDIQEQTQRLLRTVEAGSKSYQELDKCLARMARTRSSINIKG